jgi:hypothetical protein
MYYIWYFYLVKTIPGPSYLELVVLVLVPRAGKDGRDLKDTGNYIDIGRYTGKPHTPFLDVIMDHE